MLNKLELVTLQFINNYKYDNNAQRTTHNAQRTTHNYKLVTSFIVLFLMTSITAFAQSNYFYYYKSQKIYLTLDKANVSISVLDNFQKASVSNLNLKAFDVKTESTTGIQRKYAKINFLITPSDIQYFQKMSTLNNNLQIIKAQPNFITQEGKKIGMSDYFYIKLKNANDLTLLQNLATQKNVQIIEQNQFMPLWYTLKCAKNTVGSTLDIANHFFETNNFVAASPDFLSVDSTSIDPLFPQQWHLSNEIYTNDVLTGAGINVINAWPISQGANVKIAILDDGIDKTHPDLVANISSLSFDCESGASPSALYTGHGTACAGIFGAVKDNNIGTAGVSPMAKIVDVSVSYQTPNGLIKRANGINWAWQNGADIISNSWSSSVQFEGIEEAIAAAIDSGRNGKGTIVVFSARNTNEPVAYPAKSNDKIIAVGAINKCSQRKSPTSCDVIAGNLDTAWGSNYGAKLDVVAPGTNIVTTDIQGYPGYNPQVEENPNYANLDEYFSNYSGTSAACPQVAGVAALILGINPCLTGQQVRDVIEKTCRKIGNYSYATTAGRPNGTWNNEMGYGLINALAAVQYAQALGSATLDLMVKDNVNDVGAQPNFSTPYMWESNDIWTRKLPDNIEEHQNPEYNPNVPNYAYVRVTNRSCVASTGNEQLKLYWAKAGTSLEWQDSWDGNHYFPTPNNGQKLGAPIGTISIPALQANQQTVLQLPFLVPNPNSYSFAGSDQWHFCLLARIEAVNDQPAETSNLYTNVLNNNNIAWKNISIVDLVANKTNAVVAVGNPFNEPKTFVLELVKEDSETGKPIYDEAKVTLKMDATLFSAWSRGGKLGQKLNATATESMKVVNGNNVILDNIAFNANEMGTFNLNFNFLTQELTEKSKFVYHVIQKEKLTGQIIGGETYVIKKQARPAFVANAGNDVAVNKNEPITISAAQISEPATYNWYDTAGNLIFSGKDLTIATAVATTYKLEVIATADGFKDYSAVDVNLKPSVLNALAPNPATSTG